MQASRPQYNTATVYRPWRLVHLSDVYDICTLVDADDWEWLREWRWNFIWHGHSNAALYARRNTGKNRETIYMAREVMHCAEPRSLMFEATHVVDHINGNTLDNRKANLRWATKKQNARNKHVLSLVPSLDAIMAALGPCDLELGDLPF